jgi:hypothetical protein
MFSRSIESRSKKRRNQKGIALLVCIFALLLVSGIALAMLGNSSTETSVNQNYRETQVAYFAAKAGIAEAVDRMKLPSTNVNAVAPPTVMPSSTGGIVYIVNPRGSSDIVQPWAAGNRYQDTELCKENFGLSGLTNNGIGISCNTVPSGSSWYLARNSYSPLTGTTGALDYKWVRINLKSNSSGFPYYANGSASSTTLATQVCNGGTSEALLPSGYTDCVSAGMQPVYVLTSLAVTQRGTRRMVQTEVSRKVSKLPNFPAALTLDGPGSTLTPPYDAPNSNSFYVNGNDTSGCGTTNQSAVAVTDTTTKTLTISGIPSNRYSHYTGVDGTSPDVGVVCPVGSTTCAGRSVLDPMLTSTSQLQALTSSLQESAAPSNVYNGPQTNINLGSQAAPQITVVNGDLTMTGTTVGGGILLVTGTLTMSGNSSFYGVILVIGKGVFIANGGGNGSYNGSVLVANTTDSTGHLLPTLGPPVVDWSGGGGNGIYYNSCAINQAKSIFFGPFIRLASRELMY